MATYLTSNFQTELPAETIQQQFAKKFSNLLSAPPQSVGPQNSYWQYSHGFDSPLPTGGNCSTSTEVPIKTLIFPESPESPEESPKIKKKTTAAGNKKTSKAKKPSTKAGNKKNNPKAGGKKSTKKKPTKKALALTKLLKLFT